MNAAIGESPHIYDGQRSSWIVTNRGGGPTDDKPAVTLETPRDLNRVSSFLNIRVRDIETVDGWARRPSARAAAVSSD